MNKKRVCFLMTLTGLVIIICIQVYILIDNDREYSKQLYLEKNLINQTKKCIRENNCNGENITLKTLKDNNYLDEEYLSLLDGYSLYSYISYPDFKVKLRKLKTASK